MTENIEGKNVILRPITAEDTDDVIRWRNSPAVMENFFVKTPLTREIHEQWLKEKVAAGFVEQFIIVLKDSGKAVGSQYFRDIDRSAGEAEFGIFIGEESARGRGVGGEVIDLALVHAYKDMGLARVTLRLREENEAAMRLYLSRGFKKIPGGDGACFMEHKKEWVS